MMSTEKCVFISLDNGAKMPSRAYTTDAGADLYACESCVVPAHGYTALDIGVHIDIPHGYAGQIMSKSGLNFRHNIITTGLIDEGYSESICVKLYNLGDDDYEIKKGDKVAQLVLVKVIYPEFVMVEEVNGGERGGNGFGSTGR